MRGRSLGFWFQRCIVVCIVLALSGLWGCNKPRPLSLILQSRYHAYLPAVVGPPPSPEPVVTNLESPTPGPASGAVEAVQPGVTNSAEPLWDLTPALNNVPISEVIVLPEETLQTVREIYAKGQSLGNNPHAFSKIGDSTIESPFFLDRFDDGPYNLGEYAYLQKVIDYYKGSFARQGRAVYRGLHTWSMFDPAWADPDFCEPNETPIDCEFRLHHPSLVFIRVGSNDVGRSDLFRQNMTRLIELCFERGVIPIIGTKADRNEGSNVNNDMLRQLAENYDVPLWDFDRIADTIPGRGMDVDGVHLTTFYAHDYTLPYALQTGYGVHNLTALMMLYELWRNLPAAP
jgi:hypothetical protein